MCFRCEYESDFENIIISVKPDIVQSVESSNPQ